MQYLCLVDNPHLHQKVSLGRLHQASRAVRVLTLEALYLNDFHNYTIFRYRFPPIENICIHEAVGSPET